MRYLLTNDVEARTVRGSQALSLLRPNCSEIVGAAAQVDASAQAVCAHGTRCITACLSRGNAAAVHCGLHDLSALYIRVSDTDLTVVVR